MPSVAVGINGWIISTRREAMQVRKTGAVDVDLKHCALAGAAAVKGRPIQDISPHNQSRNWISSVAIGKKGNSACRKSMQDSKSRAINVDGEDIAVSGSAARLRRPKQGAAR